MFWGKKGTRGGLPPPTPEDSNFLNLHIQINQKMHRNPAKLDIRSSFTRNSIFHPRMKWFTKLQCWPNCSEHECFFLLFSHWFGLPLTNNCNENLYLGMELVLPSMIHREYIQMIHWLYSVFHNIIRNARSLSS